MTTISWTSEVWNPTLGCSRDNAECDRCFAMFVAHRGLTEDHRGLTKIRPKGSSRPGVDWIGIVRALPERLGVPLSWRKPRKVFVNSMSDLFHSKVPFEFIAAVFGVMAACPQHTFQVLTKRPERAREFFMWADARSSEKDLFVDGMPTALLTCAWEACTVEAEWNAERDDFNLPTARVFGRSWPLPNVHLGVSAGRQETAEEKVPALLQLPAAVRWVSIEPMLGPVNLTEWLYEGKNVRERSLSRRGAAGSGDRRARQNLEAPSTEGRSIRRDRAGLRSFGQGSIKDCPRPTLDWVIVGGESGAGARGCDIAWIRSVISQCRAAGVPVFCKQVGADPIYFDEAGVLQHLPIRDAKGENMDDWPEDLRVREWPVT